MAELENTEVNDETLDETIDDTSESYDEYSETGLTEADYYKEVERRKKAEEALVKYKKQAKSVTKDENWDYLTKTDLEITRFVDKNPEYEGKEDEIRTYLKKWLTISQATKLVDPDETVVNQKKTKSSSITAWESEGTQSTYTKDELAWLSQSKYNEVMALKEAWKVVIKG